MISPRFLACSIVMAIGCSSAWAQIGTDVEAESPTILSRSPFIPPDWEPPSSKNPRGVPKKTSTGYEFRGVYQLGSEYRFLVSPPRTLNGKWVTVGTENGDYEVRDYDPTTETLTLFYDSKVEKIKLAKMDANPTPMAVSGQIREASPTDPANRRSARRTIRPTTRPNTSDPGSNSAPPPPAWLKKLREEAAQRRAQAGGPGTGAPPGVNASSKPPGKVTSPPPDRIPPSPPQELLDMDIPPPPTGPPPKPSQEVLQKIQDSLYSRNPGT